MSDKQADKLIENYMNGSLTDSDCKTLYGWLEGDSERKEYFINRTGSANLITSERLDKSWEDFRSRRAFRMGAENMGIGQGRSAGMVRYRRLGIQVAKYAAVLMIGAVSTVLIWTFLTRQDQSENWVTAETVAGQKARVVLPDSTVVWLNSETTISFPPDYQKRKNREVKLAGEAYFDVKDQQKRTFTVVSKDYDITVRGTKFNVMAYEDFNRTETTLVEGSIVVRRGNREVPVHPGQRVVWDGSNMTKSRGMIRQATLWKDNLFYFDHISFRELMMRLERWYDVDITLLDESLKNENYSGYFKNEETIWQVLDVLSMTTPIEYERKEFREIVIDRRR